MIDQWRHVFKLDPDKMISDADLDAVCLSGTDAVMIGGSSGVTYENTVDLLSRVRQYELPCVLEISELEAVVPGFDLYMIPMVLNTRSVEWLIGHHRRAVERYGYIIPWDLVVPEGYIILNSECTAAKLTEAECGLSVSESTAYAQTADKLLSLPVVYLEYSGMFGDMELVSTVHRSLSNSRLFYGGGICDTETARQAAEAADTIIVGNIIYTDLVAALSTVKAIKG
ncbi:heptaprenylglyceryl phosphate synthase [Paenibacillus sp. J22TS3]|uniref:heptaprenylglyceryl phosphate synthase n=1 Tax=Paenibacillus sp. J22TS3 TaxID=2807192 RepID=UPI001BCB99E9|nr:heptaprenylglyceryl phosphate synthase [Paenibacillus sp. J22TS3]